MGRYRATLLAGEPPDQTWCDVCDEAKRATFRLAPLGAPPESDPGDEEPLTLCEGCSEGLEDGAVITGADLEGRRQRRRGSQEP